MTTSIKHQTATADTLAQPDNPADSVDSAGPSVVASRRQLVTGSVAMAGMAALGSLGFPAIIHAQSDKIKIGHLTPRTGFLGVLGEYAVMAATLAAEEVNNSLCRQTDVQWNRHRVTIIA